MPRNTSGVYTLPVASYVAGTTIKSADMNSNLSDIGTALTQSLATTGVSSMTGPVKLAAGSASAPSLTLASDTTTGWYNSAAGAWTFVSTGTAIITLGPTAITATNMTVTNLTVTGTFTVASARIVGEIIDYGGSAAPALWLLAFGQAISRTTYSSLFAAIGTTFGSGDGSTTFNVPDLRGRVTVGKDNMGGSTAGRITAAGCGITGTTLGAVGGHSVTDPGHTHTYSKPANRVSNFTSSTQYCDFTFIDTATSSATTGITIQNTGSGNAVNNVQPSIIVNKMIYAAV
jgi:microcystin-dependent protein